MNVIVLPLAQREWERAAGFYDEKLPGLGKLFTKEALEAIDLIRLYPEGCQLITRKTRKCLLHKFPYMLLYGIIDRQIVISAVAHQHRHPRSYLRI